MNYYKASLKVTSKSGRELELADIKASDRIYSHAVMTVATISNETYSSGEPNPNYGKMITLITFHQGLANASKAAESKTHTTLGGAYTYNHNNVGVSHINPNRSTQIIETTKVTGPEYRAFKKNALRGYQFDSLLNY